VTVTPFEAENKERLCQKVDHGKHKRVGLCCDAVNIMLHRNDIECSSDE
jgi:hypothetical protein